MEDWRSVIKDPHEQKVFLALSDEAWDFCSAWGLSQDTGLPEEYVRDVLHRYRALVREALVRDGEGRALFRLYSRGAAPGEQLAEARAFLVKSFS